MVSTSLTAGAKEGEKDSRSAALPWKEWFEGAWEMSLVFGVSSFAFLSILLATLGSSVPPPGCRLRLLLLVNNDSVMSISLEGLSPLYILSLVERRG